MLLTCVLVGEYLFSQRDKRPTFYDRLYIRFYCRQKFLQAVRQATSMRIFLDIIKDIKSICRLHVITYASLFILPLLHHEEQMRLHH